MRHRRILEKRLHGIESAYHVEFSSCECTDAACWETGRPNGSPSAIPAARVEPALDLDDAPFPT